MGSGEKRWLESGPDRDKTFLSLDILVYIETNVPVSSNQREDLLLRGTPLRCSHWHLQDDVTRGKWWFYSKTLRTFLGSDTWRHIGKGGKLSVLALGSCTGCLWARLCAVPLTLNRGKGPCSHPGLGSGTSWLVDSRIGPRSDFMFIEMIKKSVSRFTILSGNASRHTKEISWWFLSNPK